MILFGAISGCVSVSTKRELNDIQKKIEQRTNKSLGWNFNSENETFREQKIKTALQDKLTVDTAVEITLINNPSLQATFEELGIAKAEIVQAGLLKNPTFQGSLRQPNHDGEANKEFEIKQDILSILTFPLRKRLADFQLEQVKYTLGQAILHLDGEVRNTYYSLQAAQQMYAMQGKILKAAESAG